MSNPSMIRFHLMQISEDDYISHFDQTYIVYRTPARPKWETEKRTPSSHEQPVHDTLSFNADFRGLPGPGSGWVCSTHPRHLHRQAENVPDLRGIQSSRAPHQGQHGGSAQSRAKTLGTYFR